MSQPQITGFEILECLGQGGMAVVWKARQLSLDRIVAIKVLSPRMARDTGDIERFLKEAKSAAKLKHPGIIQVYDVNAESGLYYIVMEYVAGYTVGDWLRRKGALSEEDALLVVDSVADALDYAWTKESIIHCDIKPDNIIIDSDGTVKVADLGLARTITAMSSRQDDEYVMGTPAYMAPEQARGDASLDCRADIYSLGAMLYHLVTGKILFEGHPDDKIMEMQTSDAAVDDPLELNPKLTKPLCWLIEKMLAKDREGRPVDWAAVRADISRVKKGRMPAGPILPENSSTVGRSKRRTVQEHSAHPTKITRRSEKNYTPFAVILVILLVLSVVIAIVVKNSTKPATPSAVTYPGKRVQSIQPGEQAPKPEVKPAGISPIEKNAMDMFEFAGKWVSENRGAYAEAISRFEKVAVETRGTKYSMMAEDEVRKLISARDAEHAGVIAKLKAEVRALVEKKDFDKACEIIEGYSGRLAKETTLKRARMVDDLHGMKKADEEAKKQSENAVEKKMADLTGRVVSKLISDSVLAAYNEAVEAGKDVDLAKKDKEIREMVALFENALAIDNKIMDSFSSQIGQEITVNITSGPLTLTITEVSGGKVIGSEKLAARGTATRPREIDAASLSPSEKLKRMGQDSLPEVALVKGLMAFSSKAYSHARRYLGATNPMLSEMLVAQVDLAEKKVVEEDAERTLASKLRDIGYNVGPFDKDEWLKVVSEKAVPLTQQKKVAEVMDRFRKDFSGTQFVTNAAPILDALSDGEK